MNLSEPIRILVEAPDWWWREAVARILEQGPRDCEVLLATDADAARLFVARHRPAAALIDVDDADGRALLVELRDLDIPCLAMASSLDVANLTLALNEAASFVVKQELDPTRLCELVGILETGDSLMLRADRRVLGELIQHGNHNSAQKFGLTPRELEVLALVADGRTNAEIAESLHLARSSVKKLVSRVFERLGVRNRTEAALIAHQEGLDALGRTTASTSESTANTLEKVARPAREVGPS